MRTTPHRHLLLGCAMLAASLSLCAEPATPAARWATLPEKYPELRARDAAAQLGASEAELLAALPRPAA